MTGIAKRQLDALTYIVLLCSLKPEPCIHCAQVRLVFCLSCCLHNLQGCAICCTRPSVDIHEPHLYDAVGHVAQPWYCHFTVLHVLQDAAGGGGLLHGGPEDGGEGGGPSRFASASPTSLFCKSVQYPMLFLCIMWLNLQSR